MKSTLRQNRLGRVRRKKVNRHKTGFCHLFPRISLKNLRPDTARKKLSARCVTCESTQKTILSRIESVSPHLWSNLTSKSRHSKEILKNLMTKLKYNWRHLKTMTWKLSGKYMLKRCLVMSSKPTYWQMSKKERNSTSYKTSTTVTWTGHCFKSIGQTCDRSRRKVGRAGKQEASSNLVLLLLLGQAIFRWEEQVALQARWPPLTVRAMAWRQTATLYHRLVACLANKWVWNRLSKLMLRILTHQ